MKNVSEQKCLIEVKTDLDIYRYWALIGADGAQGSTGRLLGKTDKKAAFIGLEVHVNYEGNFIRNNTNKP